jgi:hypothetical protein
MPDDDNDDDFEMDVGSMSDIGITRKRYRVRFLPETPERTLHKVQCQHCHRFTTAGWTEDGQFTPAKFSRKP